MFPKLRCLAALAAMLTTPSIAEETSKCTDDAMLVFDASGSMASMGYNAISTPRIVDARKALRQSLPDITPFRRLGLVIYGPGPKDECSNIDVRFPPLPNTARRIIGDVDRISPDGNTPLTEAVRIAAETLDTRKEPRHCRADHRRTRNLRRRHMQTGGLPSCRRSPDHSACDRLQGSGPGFWPSTCRCDTCR